MFGLNTHDISTIIFTSLTSALITGVIVYLIQKSIDNSFTKKMEEFRASIQYTLFEQQTKFTRTYQKKIETLELLNGKMILLWKNLNSLAILIKNNISASSITKKDAEKEYDAATEIVSSSYLDFLHFYTENRLYLPDQSIKEIEEITKKVGGLCILINFSYLIHGSPPELISWANDGIKRFGLNIKKINAKKPNVILFINQILEEMKNQKEVLEKHYKYMAMDANGNISKSDSRK